MKALEIVYPIVQTAPTTIPQGGGIRPPTWPRTDPTVVNKLIQNSEVFHPGFTTGVSIFASFPAFSTSANTSSAIVSFTYRPMQKYQENRQYAYKYTPLYGLVRTANAMGKRFKVIPISHTQNPSSSCNDELEFIFVSQPNLHQFQKSLSRVRDHRAYFPAFRVYPLLKRFSDTHAP